MRSTQRRAHGLTPSPFEPRYLFQPSSTVKSSFAGRGIYMPQSIKRCSGHANHRNREAVTLALKGLYCSWILASSSSPINTERAYTHQRRAEVYRYFYGASWRKALRKISSHHTYSNRVMATQGREVGWVFDLQPSGCPVRTPADGGVIRAVR